MNKLLVASAVALALATGGAVAQTTSSEVTTTTVAPGIAAPPAGTLDVTRTQRTISPDGTRTNTDETTYHNSNGVADDSVTRTTTYPPAEVTTTNRSTSTVTETVK